MPGRKRDRAATGAALLAAARRRFARDGYDAVSVRDVAGEVGVDAALVFRYFGSKSALFGAATGPAPVDDAGADVDADPGGLPRRLLRSVVTDDEPAAGQEQLLALLRSSGHEEARSRLERQMCDGYVGAFAALADPSDRELRAELVGALLLGIAVQRSLVRTPALTAASAERVEPLFTAAVEALLHGGDVRQPP